MRLPVIFAILFLAKLATADAPGVKGTITAWDETHTTVLEHRSCVRTRYSWNYATCGSIIRTRVKLNLCSARGPGLHRYLYQIGDSRPIKSSVYCRR